MMESVLKLVELVELLLLLLVVVVVLLSVLFLLELVVLLPAHHQHAGRQDGAATVLEVFAWMAIARRPAGGGGGPLQWGRARTASFGLPQVSRRRHRRRCCAAAAFPQIASRLAGFFRGENSEKIDTSQAVADLVRGGMELGDAEYVARHPQLTASGPGGAIRLLHRSHGIPNRFYGILNF